MGSRFSLRRKPEADPDGIEDEALVDTETVQQQEGPYVLCRSYDEGAVFCTGADEALHDLGALRRAKLKLSDGTALARLLAHAIKCRNDTGMAGEVFDIFEAWRLTYPPRLTRRDTGPF